MLYEVITNSWSRRGESESNAPAFTRLSTARLFTFRRSTRPRKSSTERNGISPIASRMASIAAAPIVITSYSIHYTKLYDHLDEVQFEGPRTLQSLRDGKYAQLLPVGSHEPNLWNADQFVDSGFLGDGFLLYVSRLRVSFRITSRNSSRGMAGSCIPPRRRGETSRSDISRSPTTSA